MQLKIDSENYEQQEQSIVDNFVNALGRNQYHRRRKWIVGLVFCLANANAEIDNLQQELIKKNDENTKEKQEIVRLSYEVKSFFILYIAIV